MLILCLKKRIEGGIISIGTIAIIVDAIPVEVYFIATRENETPRNGPKNDPVEMAIIPFLFLNAWDIDFHRPVKLIIIIKPIIPAIIRI